MTIKNKGSFSAARADQDEQQKKAQSTAAKATAEKLIKPAAAPTKQRKDISALGSVKAGTWGQKATVKMPSGREVESGRMTIPTKRTEAQREANRQTREAALTSLRANLNKINTLQIKEDQPDNAQRLTVGIKPEQQYKRIIQPQDNAPLRIQSDKTWAQLRENLQKAHTYNEDGTVRGNALVKDLMMGPMDFNNPQTIDQNRAQLINDAQNAIETGDYGFFKQPDSQYAITRPDDDILNGTILTQGQSLLKGINDKMGFHGWEPPTSDTPEYNYNNASALDGIKEPDAPAWLSNINIGSTPGNNQLAQLPINRAIDNMFTAGGAIDRPRTEVERNYRAEAEKQWGRVKRAYIEDTPYYKERSAQTEYELNSINAEIEAKKAVIDDMENNGLTGDVVEENKRDYRRLLKQRAEKRFEQNQLAEETEAVEIDAGRLEGNLDDATRLKYGLNSNIDIPQNSLFGQILQHSERIRMIGSAAIQNKAESIVNDSCLMVAAMGAEMAGYDNIYEYYDSLPEGAMKTTTEIGINPYMSSKNGGYDFGGETWNWIANQYDNIVSNGLDHFMRVSAGPVGMIASAAEWFTQNYAEQTREAYEMGASQDEAHVSGFIAGMINTAANTVLYNRVESSLHELGSKLTPEMQRLIPKGLQNLIAEGGSKLAATASAALTLGQSAFEEGAEEVVEDAVKSIATMIAYDHSADMGENWDEFRRLMNEQHNWKEDFVAGAANGLLMDLFMGAYNSSYNGTRQNVSTAVNPETIGNLTTIVEAFGLEENDPTRQSAEQLLTKLRRGEPISNEEFNGIENGMKDAARANEKTPEDIQKHVPIWIQRGKNPPMELDEYMHSAEGRLEAEQNRNGAADSMQNILNQANAGTLDLTTPEGQRAFEAARAKLEEAAARLRQRIADQQAARDAYYAVEDAETENERAKADIARQVGEIAAETISEATNGRAINQTEMTNDAVVGAIDGIKDAVINQLQAESAAQDAEQERQNAVTPTEESEAQEKLDVAAELREAAAEQIDNARAALRGAISTAQDYIGRMAAARAAAIEAGTELDGRYADKSDADLRALMDSYQQKIDANRYTAGHDPVRMARDFAREQADRYFGMRRSAEAEYNLRRETIGDYEYEGDAAEAAKAEQNAQNAEQSAENTSAIVPEAEQSEAETAETVEAAEEAAPESADVTPGRASAQSDYAELSDAELEALIEEERAQIIAARNAEPNGWESQSQPDAETWAGFEVVGSNPRLVIDPEQNAASDQSAAPEINTEANPTAEGPTIENAGAETVNSSIILDAALEEQARRDAMTDEQRESEERLRQLRGQSDTISEMSDSEISEWQHWTETQQGINDRAIEAAEDSDERTRLTEETAEISEYRRALQSEAEQRRDARRRAAEQLGQQEEQDTPESRDQRAQRIAAIRASQEAALERVRQDGQNGIREGDIIRPTDAITLERSADAMFGDMNADEMLQRNLNDLAQRQGQLSDTVRALEFMRRELQRLRSRMANGATEAQEAEETRIKNEIERLQDIRRQLKAEIKYLDEHSASSVLDSLRSGRIAQPLMERIMGFINHSQSYKRTGRLGMQFDTDARVFDNLFGNAAPYMRAIYIDPVHSNEASRISWINDARERISALKLNKAESTLVQMYGEGIITHEDLSAAIREAKLGARGTRLKDGSGQWSESAAEFAPNAEMAQDTFDQDIRDEVKRIARAAQVFREEYDDIYGKVNGALKRNGYDGIGKIQAYFPHFDDNGGSAGILSGIAQRLGFNNPFALPTEIDGRTDQFKPGHQWSGHALQRYGTETTYDAVQGFEAYVEGMTNIAYHTDDIKRMRQLVNYIRAGENTGMLDSRKHAGAAALVQEGSRKGNSNDDFGNIAVWAEEYANLLAGKQSKLDRIPEFLGGRKILNIMNKLNNLQAGAAIAFNVSTAISNLAAVSEAIAEHPKGFFHSILRTVTDLRTGDDSIPQSEFLTRRYGSDSLSQTWGQVIMGKASTPFNAIDKLAANLVVRANYYAGLEAGMSPELAMKNADTEAARMMADRSKNAKPNIYSSKIFMSMLGRYQIEVQNLLEHEIHDYKAKYGINAGADTPVNVRGAGKLLGIGILQSILSYLFNEAFEKLTGNRLQLDPINVVAEGVRNFRETGDIFDAMAAAGDEATNYLPFISSGEIGTGSLSTAMEDWGDMIDAARSIFSGDPDIAKLDIAFWDMTGYITGLNQFRKSYQGAGALVKDGVYNKNGQLMFPVDASDPGVRLQTMLFGRYATEYAQKYMNGGRKALTKKETQMYEKLCDNGMNVYDAYDMVKAYSEADALRKAYEGAVNAGNTDEAEALHDQLKTALSKVNYRALMPDAAQGYEDSEGLKMLESRYMETGDARYIAPVYSGKFSENKVTVYWDNSAMDTLRGIYMQELTRYLESSKGAWDAGSETEKRDILTKAKTAASKAAKQYGKDHNLPTVTEAEYNTKVNSGEWPAYDADGDHENDAGGLYDPAVDIYRAVTGQKVGGETGTIEGAWNKIIYGDEYRGDVSARQNAPEGDDILNAAAAAADSLLSGTAGAEAEEQPEAAAAAAAAAAVPTPPPAEGEKPGAPRNPITGSRTASTAALAAIQSAPGTGPTDLHASKTRPSEAQGTSSDTRAQFGADMPEGSAVDLNLLRGQVNPKSKAKNPAQYGMARDQNGSAKQSGPAFRPELGYNAAAAKKNKVEWGKGKETKRDTATSSAAKAAAQMMTYGAISNGTSNEVNAQGYLSGERPIGAPAIDTGFKIVDKSEVDQNSPEYWRHYWKINDYVKRITGIDHIDYKTGKLVYAGTGSGSGKRSSKSGGRSYRKSSGSRKSSGRRSSGGSAAATGSGMTGVQALEYAQQLMTGAPQITVSLPSHLTTLQNYFGAGWTPAQIGTSYQNPDGTTGSYTEAQISTKQAYYNHLMDAYFAALGDSWESASAEERQEIYEQLHAIADARADELMREEEEEAQPNE